VGPNPSRPLHEAWCVRVFLGRPTRISQMAVAAELVRPSALKQRSVDEIEALQVDSEAAISLSPRVRRPRGATALGAGSGEFTEQGYDFHSAAKTAMEALIYEHERALTKLREELSAEKTQAGTDNVAPPRTGRVSRVSIGGEDTSTEPLSTARAHTISAARRTGRWSLASFAPSQRGSVYSGGANSSSHTSSWDDTAHVVISRATVALSRRQSTQNFNQLRYVERCFMDQDWQVWLLESIMSFVILLNTISVGLRSETSMGSWPGWIYVDTAFASLFTLEFLMKLRLFGYRSFLSGLGRRWNQFEVLLLVFAWVEVVLAVVQATFDSSKSMLVRTLMLLRLAKLLRMLRFPVFSELLMMVNGAIGSFKTLLYSMLLACVPVCAVALLLKASLGDSTSLEVGVEMFGTLDMAFFSSWRCFVVGDCTQHDGRPLFPLVTRESGPLFGVLYCLVQFLMHFGLFNVITAIYVENTVSAAKFNVLAIKRRRLQDREVFQAKAQQLLQLIWTRYLELTELEIVGLKLEPLDERTFVFNMEAVGKLRLSREFFDDLCSLTSFTDILCDLDISDEDQYDLFETLNAKGKGSISIREFVSGIGKLRGEARKADLVYVALTVQSMQHKLERLTRLTKLEAAASGRKTHDSKGLQSETLSSAR